MGRRSMSAEDNRIEVRLHLYDALTVRYQELGFSEVEAREQAMKDVMSCNTKQAATSLKNLTAAKGLPT